MCPKYALQIRPNLDVCPKFPDEYGADAIALVDDSSHGTLLLVRVQVKMSSSVNAATVSQPTAVKWISTLNSASQLLRQPLSEMLSMEVHPINIF